MRALTVFFFILINISCWSQQLRVGFSKLTINPTVVDDFIDVDGDSHWNSKVDKFIDNNNNGKFDAIWMAGFGNNRPVSGIHDDLYSSTMIMDSGETRVAIIAIDAIGFSRQDYLDVKSRLKKEWQLDHIIITASHNHEAPDLIGIWGKEDKSGVNKEYLRYVKQRILDSIKNAVGKLRPAKVKLLSIKHDPTTIFNDTRKPKVYDPYIRWMYFEDLYTKKCLGTLSNISNHVETVWDKNNLITSDFVYYLREALSKGIRYGNKQYYTGLGGTHLFVPGLVGGLMTTSLSQTVTNPFTGTKVKAPTFEKAKIVGHQIAKWIFDAHLKSKGQFEENTNLKLSFRTFKMPVANKDFRKAALFKLIKRKIYWYRKVKTEISSLKFGDSIIQSFPGELYPELVFGGVENPQGADYKVDVSKQVSYEKLLNAYKHRFYFGLTNDFIGYVIPKAEWDNKSPWNYGRNRRWYGEKVSMGVETAKIIYNNVIENIKNTVD